jgi:erythromycin esterase-like protein
MTNRMNDIGHFGELESPPDAKHAARGRLLACVVVGSSLLGCASMYQKPAPAVGSGALADVIADTCDAQIVFLGEEASHGVGKTFQVKTEIVRGLIQSCGFTHVAFEGQIYDFIDLQERYVAGTATREALYDAMGGLWSRAAEIDPLVKLLHEKALSGRLTISGFDGQVGSAMGYYTQTRLAQRLSRSLPTARQESCSAAIDRLAGWKFDPTHPKNEEFDEAVLGCAREIETVASGHADQDSVQYRLARSFRSFLEFSPADPRNDRDRLMYENFEWTVARLPHPTKTIVWTATIHSLKKPLSGWETMASHAVRGANARIKSVAVVGASGEYAAPGGRRTEITRADADSLEGHFAPTQNAELAYIDGDSLRRAGPRKSRVISYGRYDERDWSEWLDGVLVLAAEAPPTFIRPARPMQATMD